jgi:tryptophan synthase beta chain
MTPLLPMYSLGHNFMPSSIHAGGLRYHGMSPLVSQAAVEGLLKPRSVPQLECFEAAMLFARTEGLIVAPETSHAVAVAVAEAKKAKEEGKAKTIVFGLSGHGMMDLRGYQMYLAGELSNYELPDAVIEKNLKELDKYPKPQAVKSGTW